VSVDVVASDVGAGMLPSIAAFDLNVLFDTAVLSFTSVAFGTGLDVLGLGSIQMVSGAGPVNVLEVSLDPPLPLIVLQPASFTLFTITFDAIATGMTGIDLFVNNVSGVFGNPIRNLDVANGEISVADMPEPATLLLFGLGLAGIGFARRGILAR
jgi:hypothetical protein